MLVRNRKILATGVCTLALIGVAPAWAQNADAPTETSPAETSDTTTTGLDPVTTAPASTDIVVTGTNIQGIKPVGAPIVSLGQQAIIKSGLTNITDIARTIPQIQTIGFYREGNNTPSVNSTGGSALNLRGLGASATLLLIDGKRQTPNGTNTTYTESNAVPLVALERIEVVPDGSSAIYGSDAVAGVVNYVLRRKFEGIQGGFTYNSNRLYDEKQFSGLAGHSWESGSIVIAYERTRREAGIQGDSKYLRQDVTSLGGRDLRFSGNATSVGGVTSISGGNIIVPRTSAATGTGTNPVYPYAGAFNIYGLPTSTNGLGLTAASLRLNDANLMDTSDYTDYVGRMHRDMVSAVLTQNITPGIQAYVNAFYTKRLTVTRGISNIVVTQPSTTLASSPYTTTAGTAIPWYISGIPGIAAGAAETVFYSTYKDIGNTFTRNTSETYTVTGGLKAELPQNWHGEAYFTYGDDKTCGICSTGVNVAAFQALVNAGRINPFSTAPLDAATVALFTTKRVQNAHNSLRDFVAKANGALFDLPAGAVRTALGYEHYYDSVGFSGSQNLTANTNAFPATLYSPALNPFVNNVPYSLTSRKIDSLFAELFVPVIDNDGGFVRRLNLNGAVRYDHYSDVGSTVNPKLSAMFETAGGFSFRGSWGTSYRAPGLAEKNPRITQLVSYSTVANNTGIIPNTNSAAGTTNVILLQGANPNLTPEKGRVWTLGVDWKPEFARTLTVSSTLYNIHYKNQLIYFTGAQFLASANALNNLYKQYITVTPPPAGCTAGVESTYNPLVRDALNGLNLTGSVLPSQVCSVQAILDTRAQNAASTRQLGLDFTLNYTLETGVGDVNFNGSVTHVFSNKQKVIDGTPTIDGLDVINSVTTNYPVSWKGRGSIDWNKGVFSAGISMNYIGSYLNNAPITIAGVRQPESTVPSWSTFDIRFGIDMDEQTRFAWAKGLRINLSLNNAFDKNPPVVLSTYGAGGFDAGAIDGNNHDPYGRRVTLAVTKRF